MDAEERAVSGGVRLVAPDTDVCDEWQVQVWTGQNWNVVGNWSVEKADAIGGDIRAALRAAEAAAVEKARKDGVLKAVYDNAQRELRESDEGEIDERIREAVAETVAEYQATLAAQREAVMSMEANMDQRIAAAVEARDREWRAGNPAIVHTHPTIQYHRRAERERCATEALKQRCERGTPWDRACVDIAAAIRALEDSDA